MIRFAKWLARRILGKELTLLRNTLSHQELRLHQLTDQLTRQKQIQEETLNSLSKAPLIEYKITREVYKKHIVDKLDNPVVNSTVSPHQAGYLLGIQRALRVVEELVV